MNILFYINHFMRLFGYVSSFLVCLNMGCNQNEHGNLLGTIFWTVISVVILMLSVVNLVQLFFF